MKKIMVVFGTRPEAIKMCPVIVELKKIKEFQTIICVTGQHREMLTQVLDTFNVCPNYNLDIMKEKQDLYDITINILDKIKKVLIEVSPDLVLVHGDTSTTFATALACFYSGIDVGHVEAGLRTYNLEAPFPEEFNRQVTGIIAKYHFAPTFNAKNNLILEGKRQENIFVTGNTAIDALKTTVSDTYESELLNWVGESKLILLTAHRRENLGIPMKAIFNAVKRIVIENKDIKVIYPIHKNPIIRELANEIFVNCEQIKLVDSLDVIDFHNIMAKSYFVLTDSGGIQEEAPSLGKPVLVLRDTTERPEGVEAGTLKLIGTDERKVYNEINSLLKNEKIYESMSKSNNPYGIGNSAIQIAEILAREAKLNKF